MLGRYVMLGIAVLAAVAAVGTFLRWAISKGYLTLTPGERVIVALVFAAGIGVWGARIRRRERPFGSSMIGLALVIVLVCAYAAGPGLHLMPSLVAFAGSAAVSWGLALFAHAEKDEPLWCVAFGGAAVVPFVTSSGQGNFYALAGYGAFLLFAACFAISHRPWPVAWRVFYLATGLYSATVTVLSRDEGMPGFLTAFAFPFGLAVVGVLPFAPVTHKRAALRWLAILIVAAGFATPHGQHAANDSAQIAGVVLGAAALWLLLVDRLSDTKQSSILDSNRDNTTVLDWFDAALIPLTLCLQASGAIEPFASPAAIDGIAALLFLSFVARRESSSARDAAAAACAIMAVVALSQLKLQEPTGRIVALLGLAAILLLVHKAWPSVSWIVSTGLVTATAAALSMVALVARPPFIDPPFMTEAARTALWVLIFLILVARFRGWIPGLAGPADAAAESAAKGDDAFLPDLLGASPWAWAFLWVFIELAKAYSRSTSTLLLVIYFASTAVAAVAVGHVRRSAGLRQVGLALALLAAATAVHGAATYFDVGARVLAYLVTSAFLLGIAYWYRRRGVASAA